MAVQHRRVTLEEFMALPDDGNLHELVRGEVRSMPPKGVGGFIEAALICVPSTYMTPIPLPEWYAAKAT